MDSRAAPGWAVCLMTHADILKCTLVLDGGSSLQAVQSLVEVPAASKELQEQQFLYQPGNPPDAQEDNIALGQTAVIALALGEAAGAALQHSCARENTATILSTV